MKLLVVTESYWPNLDGGAVFERNMSLALAQKGHQVVVWAPGTKARSYQQADGGTLIEREKAVRFAFNGKYKVSYWPWWRARTMIKRHRPDVIHIHNFWFLGLSALFWAKRYRIPVVATNHFMPENALLNLPNSGRLYGWLYRLIWRYLVGIHNRCNFVTSPTETAIDLLLKNGLKAPNQAVSNGLDTERFAPGLNTDAVRRRYQLPIDRPVLLYLGRLDGEKRLDVMIAALAKLDPALSYQAVLAGGGIARRQLERQVKQLGLADRVSFTGFVDEADKPALYSAAQIFIMPSPAELQSIVTLEAMSCGLPVVAVDVAALHELCHDGHNGYLFPNADSTELAAKLTPLLNDARLRRRFGKASRQIVMEHHQEAATYRQYEAIYERLIATGDNR